MTSFREAFPIFATDDVERSIEFYESTFGFRTAFRWDAEDGQAAFAFLELEPLGIGLAAAGDAASEHALWLYTDDVDAAAERLREAGAEEVQPPADQEWGERTCAFRAPDGLLLHVGARP
jgi:catechol 2,3-dioxygenase-like lactoylglutathione lyase family enzyme